jgi:hypothetical protein
MYFKTDAAAGQNLYLCTVANVWTQMVAGGEERFSVLDYIPTASHASILNYTISTATPLDQYIQAALDACSATKACGGVEMPPGRYPVFQLFIKTNSRLIGTTSGRGPISNASFSEGHAPVLWAVDNTNTLSISTCTNANPAVCTTSAAHGLPVGATYKVSWSGFTAAATTNLAAAVTSPSTTTWTVTSGAGIANGDFIQADSEVVEVTGGGGTGSLTVKRGMRGTVPATHLISANVTVVGGTWLNINGFRYITITSTTQFSVVGKDSTAYGAFGAQAPTFRPVAMVVFENGQLAGAGGSPTLNGIALDMRNKAVRGIYMTQTVNANIDSNTFVNITSGGAAIYGGANLYTWIRHNYFAGTGRCIDMQTAYAYDAIAFSYSIAVGEISHNQCVATAGDYFRFGGGYFQVGPGNNFEGAASAVGNGMLDLVDLKGQALTKVTVVGNYWETTSGTPIGIHVGAGNVHIEGNMMYGVASKPVGSTAILAVGPYSLSIIGNEFRYWDKAVDGTASATDAVRSHSVFKGNTALAANNTTILSGTLFQTDTSSMVRGAAEGYDNARGFVDAGAARVSTVLTLTSPTDLNLATANNFKIAGTSTISTKSNATKGNYFFSHFSSGTVGASNSIYNFRGGLDRTPAAGTVLPFITDYDGTVREVGDPSSPRCDRFTLSNNGTNWTVNGTVGAAIAAATTQSVTLFALPARGKITGITTKTSTAWNGTGFTTLTSTVGDSVGGATTYMSSAYDLTAAASNTNFLDAAVFKSSTFAGSNVQAALTANQNLNANTITGTADFIVCWCTIP